MVVVIWNLNFLSFWICVVESRWGWQTLEIRTYCLQNIIVITRSQVQRWSYGDCGCKWKRYKVCCGPGRRSCLAWQRGQRPLPAEWSGSAFRWESAGLCGFHWKHGLTASKRQTLTLAFEMEIGAISSTVSNTADHFSFWLEETQITFSGTENGTESGTLQAFTYLIICADWDHTIPF